MAPPPGTEPTEPAGPAVTVHVWGIDRRGLPGALGRMARGRRRLEAFPGVRFAKALGTGRGMTVREADPLHWSALIVWESPVAAAGADEHPVVRAWDRHATERLRLDLRPLSTRGRWSGQEPFGAPVPQPWDGPVAAVTRARIAPRRLARFWRAVPPVSAELAGSPGLRLSLGIGEAPVGLQGTLSVWDSAQALTSFAYGRAAHLDAVRRTASEGWYAEELFARLAVLGARGTYRGTGLEPS